MKILKSKSFREHESLAVFVNEQGIRKEDILIITMKEYGFFLFYYAEK
ncbi:hypothetical protein SAMN05428975_1427 [Mucilaginibacter sp. OK268]|nr:hypothetical protein SAMN05428975_1427 [Mucilaginibacter sp. OK268]